MKNTLYIPVYSLALFTSALLLFSIQPVLGKLLLPLLGGAPAVWNAAMLFFQFMLLVGYGWAHFAARFVPVRTQVFVHLALMLGALATLPISLHGQTPPPAENVPIFWQLGVMTMAVGAPFFVLAATAPMLQRWFAASGHPQAHNPYFLYAASNVGSVAALLLYPFAVEPLLDLDRQTPLWANGFEILMGLIALCGLFLWLHKPLHPHESGKEALSKALTWRERLFWIVLAFVPSSLMLGVTTAITTDIASVPLLWIIPLALYLATFIFAFARRQIFSYNFTLWGMTVFLSLLLLIVIVSGPMSVPLALGIHCGLFFFTALACHLRLAATRPHADHLTEYYLLISVGGVLGGVLNGLIAPMVFNGPLEYPLVLLIACLLRRPGESSGTRAPEGINDRIFAFILWASYVAALGLAIYSYYYSDKMLSFIAWFLACGSLLFTHTRRWFFLVLVAVPLLLNPGLGAKVPGTVIHQSRNFFGVLRVADDHKERMRLLIHGTTLHGTQSLIPGNEGIPLTYYHPKTTIGDVFKVMNEKAGPQRIAIIGLGAGSLAAYKREGRVFDFYEIDPDVVKIAKNLDYFTYLTSCGAACSVILGDGRLEIAKAADKSYDLILLDVFSSDNIPPHIITKEAFGTYTKKLKSGGLIAAHLSSRYLDLPPVADASARENGFVGLTRYSDQGTDKNTGLFYAGTVTAVFAQKPEDLAPFLSMGWKDILTQDGLRTWTDSYASILPVLFTEERKIRSFGRFLPSPNRKAE